MVDKSVNVNVYTHKSESGPLCYNETMRRLIHQVSESFLYSYLLTYAILVAIFVTKVDIATAMGGALFYAIFFNFFTVFIVALLDGLLPPPADPQNPSSP